MQWQFSDEQVAYRAALRAWLADVAGPEQIRGLLGLDASVADPSAFERRMVDDGMAGVGLSEDIGGQGGGPVELAITAEELARATAPSGAWLATVLAMPVLARSPERAAAAIAGGGAAVVVAADGIPEHRRTVRVDSTTLLDGRVRPVLGADRADVLVVPAETGGWYVVVRDEPGATIAPIGLLDRSRSMADVALVGTSAEEIVGDADVDEDLAQIADLAAVLVAADALGAMERMLELAVSYSRQRHQFGVPIGSFQAVQHAAATVLVDLEAGRSGVYYAAASLEAGHPDRSMHAAAVKAQVTAATARAADAALTMHGAIGYTWEHDLHLSYKRAKLDQHLFGAPSLWNGRIADRLNLVAAS